MHEALTLTSQPGDGTISSLHAVHSSATNHKSLAKLHNYLFGVADSGSICWDHTRDTCALHTGCMQLHTGVIWATCRLHLEKYDLNYENAIMAACRSKCGHLNWKAPVYSWCQRTAAGCRRCAFHRRRCACRPHADAL